MDVQSHMRDKDEHLTLFTTFAVYRRQSVTSEVRYTQQLVVVDASCSLPPLRDKGDAIPQRYLPSSSTRRLSSSRDLFPFIIWIHFLPPLSVCTRSLSPRCLPQSLAEPLSVVIRAWLDTAALRCRKWRTSTSSSRGSEREVVKPRYRTASCCRCLMGN